MLYNVHAYAVVKVLICGVEAPSMEEAIKASEDVNFHPLLQREYFAPDAYPEARKQIAYFDFAEEITAYLIDEQGDIEYEKSEWFEADGTTKIVGGKTRQEKAFAVLEKIAALKKWGEPDDNGEPFEPCDGADDSHECLMDLIDESREVLGLQSPAP